MLAKGDILFVNGHGPLVVENAYWELSLKLSCFPHKLWVLFEGEKKFIRFESDATGEFKSITEAHPCHASEV